MLATCPGSAGIGCSPLWRTSGIDNDWKFHFKRCIRVEIQFCESCKLARTQNLWSHNRCQMFLMIFHSYTSLYSGGSRQMIWESDNSTRTKNPLFTRSHSLNQTGLSQLTDRPTDEHHPRALHIQQHGWWPPGDCVVSVCVCVRWEDIK